MKTEFSTYSPANCLLSGQSGSSNSGMVTISCWGSSGSAGLELFVDMMWEGVRGQGAGMSLRSVRHSSLGHFFSGHWKARPRAFRARPQPHCRQRVPLRRSQVSQIANRCSYCSAVTVLNPSAVNAARAWATFQPCCISEGGRSGTGWTGTGGIGAIARGNGRTETGTRDGTSSLPGGGRSRGVAQGFSRMLHRRQIAEFTRLCGAWTWECRQK